LFEASDDAPIKPDVKPGQPPATDKPVG
jgi:hypothetical protein